MQTERRLAPSAFVVCLALVAGCAQVDPRPDRPPNRGYRLPAERYELGQPGTAVTLFAPILGGLYFPRAGRWAALAAMIVGVGTLLATHLSTDGLGYGWASPSFLGLVASAITYLILAVF